MKVTNIQWDVDDEKDLDYLPTELEITDKIEEDEVGEYLSNLTGFCHKGFVIEK